MNFSERKKKHLHISIALQSIPIVQSIIYVQYSQHHNNIGEQDSKKRVVCGVLEVTTVTGEELNGGSDSPRDVVSDGLGLGSDVGFVCESHNHTVVNTERYNNDKVKKTPESLATQRKTTHNQTLEIN